MLRTGTVVKSKLAPKVAAQQLTTNVMIENRQGRKVKFDLQGGDTKVD